MKARRSEMRIRIGSVVAVVGVSLLVTACGGNGYSSSGAQAPSSSAASGGSTGSTVGVSISTSKGADGTYLVGRDGRSLYLWVADAGGKSACAGACAKVWPPVIAKGKPTVSGGVTPANLGTISRSDGAKQVTYMGHPLYYYIADSGPGKISGQGSNSFGAKWWLVAPSGSAITASASSAGSSSSGSAYGGTSSSASSGGSSGGGGWG